MKASVAAATAARGGRRARRVRRPVRRSAPCAATGARCWPPSTDGVGTKVEIARRMDKHDTIGIDLVAMVVDDLVVCGAEPLFMTDYIATGKVVPERIAAIVSGIAEGCRRAGGALVGGETAEHPGLLAPDEYDVAGAGTGVVEADDLLGPDRVRAGDVVVAMASSGLHSNGYSLARHVLFDRAGWDSTATCPSWAARSARSCSSRPGSTRWTAWRWPGRLGARARVRPRDRRRARGQPGPGAAGGGERARRPVHLDAGAGVRPGRPARRGGPRRAGAHLQHGRRDGGRGRPGRRRRDAAGAGRARRAGLGGRGGRGVIGGTARRGAA